jgi:hypothetical protein
MNSKAIKLSQAVRVALALVMLLAPLVAPPAGRSSAAAPPVVPFVTFTQVADSSTAIPGGTGTFTNFPYSPALDGGSVALVGTGVGGQQGVYRFVPPNPTVPPNPVKVADLNTAIPGGAGNFTGFAGSPVISGDAVAFLGTGAGGQQGVYRFVPPNPIKVADLSTPIPNGTGVFTAIPTDPCISGDAVVFSGSGSAEQQGIYLANTNLTITPIADTNTEVPGGSGNFTSFVPFIPVDPCISGNYAVFFGAGIEGQQGIYLVDISMPQPPPIIPVADGNTAIPGGAGNFQFFSALASEANDVAFVGGRGEVDLVNVGVYKVLNVLSPTPPPIEVADLFTAVPDGSGNFTAFGSVAIDPGTVVFEGFSSNGAGGTRKGLYTDFGGTLAKLIATGDTLGGRVVGDLRFGLRGFNNHQAAFAVDFNDGTHAVFMATLSLCSIGFTGFHPPIGGADSTGGTYANPVRAFKLKSTVPVKMTLTACDGQPLATGVHTIQVIKFSNATTSDPAIDATPTDAATTGNQFRLTDAATGEWHFNLSTTALSTGIWQIKATLSDGSAHTAFIELK